MKILEIVTKIAPLMGLAQPGSIFSSTDQEPLEWQAVVNDVVDDIRLAHDWSRLTEFGTVTGNGVDEGFSLPANFDRFTKTGQLWRPSLNRPLQQVGSTDDWIQKTMLTFQNTAYGYWIMVGNQLRFSPILGNAETVRFAYQKKEGVLTDVTLAPKDYFTSDSDAAIWPDVVVRTGLRWRWKANKGVDYTEELADFNTALAKYVESDGGPGQVITSNRAVSRYQRSMGQYVF